MLRWALRLHHCGFGRNCHGYSQDTHYFLLTCLDVLSQPRGYYDAFAGARAGCSAGRYWLLHPGRHCPGRGLLRLSLHRRAAGRCRCVSIIAGPSVIRKLARHDTCIYSFSYFTIGTSGRARGCCAGVLRRRAAAACWKSAWGAQALKTHATNSLLHICFASFCHEGHYFSPLHEGLALCFARHVSAHHSMLPLVYRLTGNSTSALGLLRLGLLEVRVVYTIFARHKP